MFDLSTAQHQCHLLPPYFSWADANPSLVPSHRSEADPSPRAMCDGGQVTGVARSPGSKGHVRCLLTELDQELSFSSNFWCNFFSALPANTPGVCETHMEPGEDDWTRLEDDVLPIQPVVVFRFYVNLDASSGGLLALRSQPFQPQKRSLYTSSMTTRKPLTLYPPSEYCQVRRDLPPKKDSFRPFRPS